MQLKKQQTLKLEGKFNRKVYLHQVGYNGYSKRLTLPISWCNYNEISEYDKLVIVERLHSLEILTEKEFLRRYPELDGCEKGQDNSAVRW